jgi:RNA polymerase sigma-70 factor (ECF subfamily)
MTESGLRAIFLAERPMFRRLLVARLGSAEEAEDVLQEVWLKIDQASRPVAEPVGYLYRMAANLATDRRRSMMRREMREADWADAHPEAAGHYDMERALMARERLAQVEAALATMPPRVATAFRLYRFEELPQKQIAAHMDISVSRVEQLLHDAYRRLHLRIGGGDHAPPRRLSDGKGEVDGG